MTIEDQGHDPSMVRTQYLENSCRCYFSSNHYY